DGRLPQAADRIFRELPGLLQPQDLLVFNDTEVIKARLFGEKDSGGAVEALVERVLPGFEVWAHVRASKSPKPGSRLRFAGPGGDGFVAEVLGRTGPDQALFHLRFPSDPLPLLQAHGHVPLPPYITHEESAADESRYQTVFAAKPGAVAAPTASLHFDEGVLRALDERGIQRVAITLHVGAGTFQPVRTENLREHQMHSEWFEVSAATVAAIEQARAARVAFGAQEFEVQHRRDCRGTQPTRGLSGAAARANRRALMRIKWEC
ncbi:MAG: S-adenosylmethionine:tRNA ribosyltransferase-isomerase, partial [Betaproteobacteria bacterium]